jgi:hypothetical protein
MPQAFDCVPMGLFKNLFGKRESRAVRIARKVLHEAQKESKPYAALSFAIIESTARCLEKMKPFFLPGETDRETHFSQYAVFQEFFYFFIHMSNRAASSEGFSEQERRAFLQTLFPGLIATVIDLFTDDWPEEIEAKIRTEIYDNIRSAEIEYSTSKDLITKGYKPLSGDALLKVCSAGVFCVAPDSTLSIGHVGY